VSVWVLEGFDTGAHHYAGYDGIRHREYTTSKRKSERFALIPRIDFTDSGHGIVFSARPHSGRRLPERRMDYVREQLALLAVEEKPKKS
jgi:hypothetical protein